MLKRNLIMQCNIKIAVQQKSGVILMTLAIFPSTYLYAHFGVSHEIK